jgi:serine/threonine-protein kinase
MPAHAMTAGSAAMTKKQTSAEPRRERQDAALPSDLVAGGRGRLAAASMAAAAGFTMVFSVMHVARAPQMAHANVVAVACVALSLAMFALTRTRIATRRLLDIGLGYEVVGALGISLAEVLATDNRETAVRGVSWVCLWIALFPMVVPTGGLRTLVAAIASAFTGIVAIHLGSLAGKPLPSFIVGVYLVTPNFVAAGLAVLFSQVIERLGADVRRAREMGSYRLVELLGKGGMGEVWRARHRMLAREAAIKLVSPTALGAKKKKLDTEGLLRRFEREARATAMLTSPHTIHIYDFGRTADGTLFYAMELLVGVDLETMVRAHGPVVPERAIHFLRQICDSLAEAHASGLVHRDIKPANLYACRLGVTHDFIKVLDFGIVALHADSGDVTRLTKKNAIAGTPAYLAPEAVTNPAGVDHRADIYALGCVAYWLVTGELVFEGETAVKMIYGHVEQKPRPPSQRTELELPPGLERVILECLSKDPAGRPQSATALAQRLDAIAVAEPWDGARAAAWWSSHEPLSQPPKRGRHKSGNTIAKA